MGLQSMMNEMMNEARDAIRVAAINTVLLRRRRCRGFLFLPNAVRYASLGLSQLNTYDRVRKRRVPEKHEA